MARYVVSSLKSAITPAGAVLDRIIGPGWTATPSSLLDLLEGGSHEFVLEGGDHWLAAQPDTRGVLRIVVVDGAGNEVQANLLPHWQIEDHRRRQEVRRSWWQRLLDPDAA